MGVLKVVRGPDWKWGNQDGGEGGTGTVLKMFRKPAKVGSVECAGKTAIVNWSLGSKNVYRVGAENAFDLRILDDTGRKHRGIICDSCRTSGIRGLRWKCVECDDYDLCTSCYMSDKHETLHAFLRIDSPGSKWVKVPMRKSSIKVRQKRGIDGDSIIELLVNAALEEQVGNRFYYPNHLPVLDVPPFLIEDKVKIHSDKEFVKSKQAGHGGWNEKMVEALGKVGEVIEVDEDLDLRVRVNGHEWSFNPKCVTRMDDSEDVIGDAISEALSELINEQGAGILGQLLRNLTDNISIEVKQKQISSSSVSSSPSSSSSSSSSSGSITEMVKKLIEKHGDVNYQDEDGESVLHVAAEKDFEELIEELLKQKANIDIVTNKGQSALHLAVENNSIASVKVLLKHDCSVHIPDSYGNTALHYAINRENNQIIELLVTHPKTDLKLKNNRGHNALHHAAWLGNDFALQKIIAKADFIVDEKDDDQNTALHLSIRKGHFQVTKILLEKGGCGYDIRNEMQQTPLLVAAKMSRCPEVELLVFFGANIHAKDEDGNSAVHLALMNQRIEEGITLVNAPAINRIFLEIAKVRGVERNSGLAIACFLAQKGCDLEEKNQLGKSPIDLALSVAVRELLQKFAGNKKKPHVENAEPKQKAQPVTECMVCSEELDLVSFKPCGHQVVCQLCSQRMKRCIYCKKELAREDQAEPKEQPNTRNSGRTTYSKQKQNDVLFALGARKK